MSGRLAVEFDDADGAGGKGVFEGVAGKFTFDGIEYLGVKGADFLTGVFRRDFKDASAGDPQAIDGEGGRGGLAVIHVGDVEKDFVGGAAGADIEISGSGFERDALDAVMTFEEAGDGSGGQEITDAVGDLVDDGVGGPAVAVKISGGGYFHAVAVALEEIHGAGVVNAGEPFGEDGIGIVWRQAEVTFGDGDGNGSFRAGERLLEVEQLFLDADGKHFHQLGPGAFWIFLIAPTPEDGIAADGGLAHGVNGDVIDVFAGALDACREPSRYHPSR